MNANKLYSCRYLNGVVLFWKALNEADCYHFLSENAVWCLIVSAVWGMCLLSADRGVICWWRSLSVVSWLRNLLVGDRFCYQRVEEFVISWSSLLSADRVGYQLIEESVCYLGRKEDTKITDGGTDDAYNLSQSKVKLKRWFRHWELQPGVRLPLFAFSLLSLFIFCFLLYPHSLIGRWWGEESKCCRNCNIQYPGGFAISVDFATGFFLLICLQCSTRR